MYGNGVIGRMNATRSGFFQNAMQSSGNGPMAQFNAGGPVVSGNVSAGGSANVQATAIVLVALLALLVISHVTLK